MDIVRAKSIKNDFLDNWNLYWANSDLLISTESCIASIFKTQGNIVTTLYHPAPKIHAGDRQTLNKFE